MTFPTPVAYVLMDDGFLVEEDIIAEGTARSDDAYWLRFVRRPVTPQRFVDWWVARRFVVPRDVRKR